MIGSVVLVAALGLAGTGDAEVRPAVVTGDKAIDELVADIAAKRRNNAIGRIAYVTTFAGQRRIVRTPSQFVERLLGCSPIADSLKGFGGDYSFSLMWSCHGVKYRTVFDSLHEKPYVDVLLQDEKLMAERIVAPAPPAPVRPGEAPISFSPSVDLLNRVATAAMSGEATVPVGMRANGPIRLERRDVSAKVSIVERDEEGATAFYSITREAFEKVGRPTGFSCVSEKYFGTCTFVFTRPGVGLTIDIGAQSGVVNFIAYTWQTPEQNALDVARFAR